MAAAPVVHFEVIGKDAKKLQNFYGKLFDWQIQNMPEMNYGMVETPANGNKPGKGSIDGGIGQSQHGAPNHVTFYVQVPDLQATLKKVESMGGKTVMPPMDVPGGPTIAQLQDPEGNLVGLVKQ